MAEDQASGRATVVRLDGGLPLSHIAPKLRGTPHPDMDAVERRRAHLWTVAGVLLVSLSAAVLVLFLGQGLDTDQLLPEAPMLRYAFLGLSVAFMLYVVDQERRLRQLTRELFDERVLTASLQARIADLATLTKVGRVVNSVLTLEEVLEVILTSAFELTGATNGSVMLEEHGELRVAASAGERPAPLGAVVQLGDGVAGWVAEKQEPLLINGALSTSQFPSKRRAPRSRSRSSVIAPLIAGGELLGVLAVERPSETEAFAGTQLRSVALFAEHAATAVSNAYRYGKERDTAQQLADVLEKRAEFVATMVHELKTPLTVIIGFTSLLENKWDTLGEGRRGDILASVRGQAERLRGMVDEVLRTASAEAGADMRHQPVDLSLLLTALIESTAALAEERESQERLIRLRGADEVAIVSGDPDGLYRVFENLLENAVKYSPPGSPIEVTIARQDDEIRVHITDHGDGIPEEDVEIIFERFRRTTRTVAGGVGLGLYIVRALVQSHGGRVWVRSTVGEGTTFTVALPQVRDASIERAPVTVD